MATLLSTSVNGTLIASNYVQSTLSMYSPIYYDGNDSSYYLDPNGTSNLSTIYAYSYQGNGNVAGTGAASYHPSGIYSTGNNWLYGSLYMAGNNMSDIGGITQNQIMGRPNVQWGASGSATGAVIIKFPGNTDNYGMVHAVIDIYEYNGNNVSTIIVGGHNWGSQWYSYGANVVGYTNKQVRVGVKDGKYCIIIGDGSSTWSYGQVVLRKIQNGSYYSGIMNVGSGYTIGIESDSYSWVSGDLRTFRSSGSMYMNEQLVATQSWVNSQGYLSSVPSNYVTTSGGQTIAGITYFSNVESLQVYGIRGRFANEYMHLYNKVGVGHPGGWGQGEGNTPVYGLSTYGGVNIAYANDGGATINTYTRINKNWGGGDYSAEAFTIRGTYPSIALRSTQHNNVWLIHNDDAVSFYYGGGVDSNNWSTRFRIPTNGDIYMSWADANISTLLAAKQNSSTAITTSNIGSQSVSYATTAGVLTSMNISQFTNNSGYLTSLPSHNHDDRYYTETESDARYLYYRGYSASGDTQTFQSTANTLRFDQVGALDNGSWSNQPTGYYTYGGILSLRGDSFGLQIYGSHTGDLVFKTQWNNDQHSGWRTVIHSSNIGSQSVSYASTAGSAPNAGNVNQFYNVTLGDGNGLRFWGGSDSYKISMGVGALYQYGPVTDYSIKMQMNDSSTDRGFTWGRISHAPIAALNSTSGDMQIAGSLRAAGHLFTSYNGNNILLRSANNEGGTGILLQNSGGNFKFQIYGDGTSYGFLNGNWASWDIRKTVSGAMYMNNDSTYYLQTNSTSNFVALNIQGNAVVHAGNIGSQSVASANQVSGVSVSATEMNRLKTTLGVTGLPYSCDIVVEGDPNTYYPVHFIWGDQDVWRRIIIKRGYSEQAPWDPIGTGVHHGGLLLDWEGNFGGWGGADYSDRLRVFQESYTTICADMYRTTHSMGYTFFLRGGGAVYHIFSDQSIRGYHQEGVPDIAYDTSFKFYDNANPSYIVYAPAPVTTINSSRIDGLRTKKQSQFDGRYLRQGVDISGIGAISSTNFLASNAYYLNGTSYYLNSSNGGIYTNARFEAAGNLHIGGSSQFNGNVQWFSGTSAIGLENQSTFARFAFNKLTFWDWNNGYDVMTIDDGYVSSATSFRAPIFYDSEDTGYYVDPNSESKLRKLWINNGGAGGVGWSTGLNMGDGSNYWNLIQDAGTARQRNFGAGGFDWYNNGGSPLMILSNAGNLSVSGTITTQGNSVITSGNIGSQSVNYATTAGNADTVDGLHASAFATRQDGTRFTTDLNSILSSGFFNTEGLPSNAPYPFAQLIVAKGIDTGLQIYGGYDSNNLWFRGWGYGPEIGGFYPWRKIWHDGNQGSGSGLNADMVDGYHMNQGLLTSDGPTFANVYTSGWFRNYGFQGMYNQDYGTHFYSNGGQTWVITGSGGTVELQFRSNHQSTLRGSVYADISNNIGFLNNGGDWALRVSSARNVEIFGSDLTLGVVGSNSTNIIMGDNDEGGRVIHCNSDRIGFLTQAGSWGAWLYDSADWEAVNSVRAPIFYDSNDTSYYLDPNSASRLNSLTTIGRIYSNEWIQFDNSSGLYSPTSNAHFYPNNASYGSWRIAGNRNGYNGIEFDASNGNVSLMVRTDSNETGLHNNNSGWYLRWNNGSLSVSKNTFGGGNMAEVLDSINYTSYITGGSTPASSGAFTQNGNFISTFNSTVGVFTYSTGSGIFQNDFESFGLYNYESDYSGSPNRSMLSYFDTLRLFLETEVGDITRKTLIEASRFQLDFINTANTNTNTSSNLDTGGFAFNGYGTSGYLSLWVGFKSSTYDATNKYVEYRSYSGNGDLYVTGQVYANQFSDAKYKDNVTPIDNALEKVKAIPGVEFTWNALAEEDINKEGTEVGVIAQQVQAVYPQAVREVVIEKEDSATSALVVDYEKLLPLALQSIRELTAMVEQLQEEVNLLKAK